MTVARIVEYFTVGTALIVGGLWLGALNHRVQAGESNLSAVAADVKTTPVQVAVLQAQMTAVQETQKMQTEKLDRILEEVRSDPRR